MGDERDSPLASINCEHLTTVQGAVRLELYGLQGRVVCAGQSQRPPQECCEAVGTGESRHGDFELLTNSHPFMHVRTGGALA